MKSKFPEPALQGLGENIFGGKAEMKPSKKASGLGCWEPERGRQGPLSVLGLVCVRGEPLEESWVLEDKSRSEEGAAGGPSYGQTRIMTKPRGCVAGAGVTWGKKKVLQ